MIDLELSCGLPLRFDEVAEKFTFGDDVTYHSINKVPLSSMLPGLLNKALRYPQFVYTEHHNIRKQSDPDIFSESGLNYDIVMMPSGLMGVEFIRSHIFYSCLNENESSICEIVEVLNGVLTILLQKNKPKSEWDFETRVSEGLVVKLKAGEKFSIPKGYYYTFINIKDRPVVFSRFYFEGNVCDYSQLKREQGLAYFAIRKNAKQEIVLNPRYRDIPKIQKINPEGQIKFKRPELSQDPLYFQLVNRGPELATWFN